MAKRTDVQDLGQDKKMKTDTFSLTKIIIEMLQQHNGNYQQTSQDVMTEVHLCVEPGNSNKTIHNICKNIPIWWWVCIPAMDSEHIQILANDNNIGHST